MSRRGTGPRIVRPRLVAVLAVGALALAGCAADATTEPTISAGRTVSQSAGQQAFGRDLSPADFNELISQDGVVILDVRTPEEFAAGHIAGAINIDALTDSFQAGLNGLDRDLVYAVYCRSGNRSDAALHQMADLGFTQAHHLAGGIGAWEQAGYPVVS